MLPIVYLEVPSYALWATFGLIVSLVFALVRSFKIDLPFKYFLLYIVVSAILCVAFARVFFVVGMIPQYGFDANVLLEFLFNGGIVFYGGLFGIITGIVIVSRIIKKDKLEMLDLFAPAFPLFHIFGRMGCLFAGCCYGIEWPWGVIMADDPETIRFPVQFFEAICNLCIFIFLMTLSKITRKDRGSIYVYLLCYSVVRFILEFFRGDDARGLWFGGLLSSAQIISLLIFIIVLIHLLLKWRKKEIA